MLADIIGFERVVTWTADRRRWRPTATITALALSSLTACGAVSHSGTSVSDGPGARDAGVPTADGGVHTEPHGGDASTPCTWTERAIVGAVPPMPGTGLGSAVALDGRAIIVGASAYPKFPGSAYVFDERGATWSQLDRLVGGESDLDSFGNSLAVSGDSLLVGAPTADRTIPNSQKIGGVSFFTRSGSSWVLGQFVPPEDASDFGESVALSGALAAVGGTNPVRAFRREDTAWLEDGMIPVPGDLWTVVALSGDTLAVGMPNDGERAESAGAVYVYRRQASMASTYVREAKLLGSVDMYSGFGASMALDGDVLAVGASSDPSVYVFERTGSQWTQAIVLSSPHPSSRESFGSSLALDGTHLAVGAPVSFSAGSVHLYERVGGEWQYRSEVRSSRPIVSLGASVALRGKLVVAGAPQDDAGGKDTGSAVVWECIAQ